MAGNSQADKDARSSKAKADIAAVWGARRAAEARAKAAREEERASNFAKAKARADEHGGGATVPTPAPRKKEKKDKTYGHRNVDTSTAWAMGTLPNPRGQVSTSRQPTGAQASAQRWATGVRTNSLDKRRAERIAVGEHKGKYLGPDEFKGDISTLKAWRKAGSKQEDKAKFAAKAKGTGWHGTKGKGQGGEKDFDRRKIDYATDNMGRKTVVQYEKRKTS